MDPAMAQWLQQYIAEEPKKKKKKQDEPFSPPPKGGTEGWGMYGSGQMGGMSGGRQPRWIEEQLGGMGVGR